MDNQVKQGGAPDDPFEESLRQILSNNSAGGGRLAASLINQAGAQGAAANMSPAERRAADDAANAAKIRKEQKILFWLNLFRPLAIVSVLALLGWFVLRISTLGR